MVKERSVPLYTFLLKFQRGKDAKNCCRNREWVTSHKLQFLLAVEVAQNFEKRKGNNQKRETRNLEIKMQAFLK